MFESLCGAIAVFAADGGTVLVGVVEHHEIWVVFFDTELATVCIFLAECCGVVSDDTAISSVAKSVGTPRESNRLLDLVFAAVNASTSTLATGGQLHNF